MIKSAVLDELFAYDRNDTTDGGPSGTEYDNLSFADKLKNLTETEIAAFAEKNSLNDRQTNKLQNIFEDAEAKYAKYAKGERNERGDAFKEEGKAEWTHTSA